MNRNILVTATVMVVIFFLLKHNCNKTYIELGNTKNSSGWVYLSGLTSDINSEQEINNRQILDELGQELHIKFVAIIPKHRDSSFNNKLCWPHYTKKETIQTYNEILTVLNETKITGYIGFSNGGFFLNQLAQIKKLDCPVISIGSGGMLHNSSINNKIHFLIGKNDTYHYEPTINLFKNINQGNNALKATLTQFNGSHQIDKRSLKELLTKVQNNLI